MRSLAHACFLFENTSSHSHFSTFDWVYLIEFTLFHAERNCRKRGYMRFWAILTRRLFSRVALKRDVAAYRLKRSVGLTRCACCILHRKATKNVFAFAKKQRTRSAKLRFMKSSRCRDCIAQQKFFSATLSEYASINRAKMQLFVFWWKIDAMRLLIAMCFCFCFVSIEQSAASESRLIRSFFKKKWGSFWFNEQ